MKTLAYLCAFGPEYHRMVRVAIESLRLFGGKWEGDIVVFTDGDFVANCDGVKVEKRTIIEGKFGKIVFGRELKTHEYDRVLYLDCDVLTIGDIRGLSGQSDALLAFVERQDIAAKDWECFMPKHWAHEPGKVGYNTGIITGSGMYWQGLLLEWSVAVTRHQTWNQCCKDQPAFNALNVEGKICVKPLPAEWLCLPFISTKITEKTKFVHFNIAAPGDRATMMEVAFDLLKNEQHNEH